MHAALKEIKGVLKEIINRIVSHSLPRWSVHEVRRGLYSLSDRVVLLPSAPPHMSLGIESLPRSFFFHPFWARRINIHFGSGQYRMQNHESLQLTSLACHSRATQPPPPLKTLISIGTERAKQLYGPSIIGFVDGVNSLALSRMRGVQDVRFGIDGHVELYSKEAPQSYCDFSIQASEPASTSVQITDEHLLGGEAVTTAITFSKIAKIKIRLGSYFFRPAVTADGFIKLDLNGTSSSRLLLELYSVFSIIAEVVDASGNPFQLSDLPLMKLCLSAVKETEEVRVSCLSSPQDGELVFIDRNIGEEYAAGMAHSTRGGEHRDFWDVVSLAAASLPATAPTFLIQGLRQGSYEVRLSGINFPDQKVVSNILEIDVFQPLSVHPSELLLMPGKHHGIDCCQMAIFTLGGHSFELTLQGGPFPLKTLKNHLKFSVVDGPGDLIELSALDTSFPLIRTKAGRIGGVTLRIEVSVILSPSTSSYSMWF